MGLLIEGWLYRQAIPILPTQLALAEFTAVLTDAMLPVAVTDVLFDVTEGALASGGDLRISVDEDGDTLVGLDLRRWDKAAGKIEIAYRVPATSVSLTTTLYLWWGKEGAVQPAANEPSGQYAAYDDNFVMASPCGCTANRTSTSLTFTSFGTPTLNVPTIHGGSGTRYNNPDNGEYGQVNEQTPFNFGSTSPFTLSCIASLEGFASVPMMMLSKIRESVVYQGYSIYFHDGVKELQFTMHPAAGGAQVVAYPFVPTPGQFYHYAGTYDGSQTAAGMHLFIDGTIPAGLVETDVDLSSGIAHSDEFLIGARGWGKPGQQREWNGVIAEVRVSNINRSAAWQNAEAKNLKTPASFYGTFSAPTYLSAPETIDNNYDLALAIFTSIAELRDYDLALYIDVTQDEVVDNNYDLALAISTIIAESRDYDLALLIREPAEGGSSGKFRSSAIKRSIVQQISRNIV
jgi:hypothetical protein